MKKMLEDKKAIRKCIHEGGDIKELAKKRGIKFATPLWNNRRSWMVLFLQNKAWYNLSCLFYWLFSLSLSIYRCFSFIIEPESDQPHPIDNQIAVTVIFILKQFFSVKERAMLMICDTLDGKEEKRKQLFNRWYDKYNIRHEIQKFDASAETEDYKLWIG